MSTAQRIILSVAGVAALLALFYHQPPSEIIEWTADWSQDLYWDMRYGDLQAHRFDPDVSQPPDKPLVPRRWFDEPSPLFNSLAAIGVNTAILWRLWKNPRKEEQGG